MELVLEIADLVINSCYSTAVEKIGQQLENGSLTDEQKAKLVFYRAVSKSELGDFDSATKDLDACESQLGKTGIWHYRYGQACFMINDFSNALIHFKQADDAQDIKDEDLKKTVKNWINKTLLELGNPHIGNINDSVFIKGEKPRHEEDSKTQPEEPTSNPTATASSDTLVLSIDDISHDWYQNNDFVFLSILKKKIKGDCIVSFSDNYVEISFPNGGKFGANLAHRVNTSESSYSQTEKKAEIKLKKSESGISWDALIKEKVRDKNVEVLPSYPTSNKNKKNWDNVDREIEKELHKDKPEGEDAMNDLFKQIYSGADEETRRAMIKSYQTSNGTVLSTNWGEVKEKDYEGKDYVSPPDHLEARKPEI